MGDSRPRSAAIWALASVSDAGRARRQRPRDSPPATLTIWLPKNVSTSQTAMTTSAAVAARRKTTEPSVASASQKRDVERPSTRNQVTSRSPLSASGTMPSRMMPTPDSSSDDRGQDQRDDREARHELAVDDVVAMDGLGHQPGQGALGALAS